MFGAEILIEFLKVHPDLGTLSDMVVPDLSMGWLGYFLTSIENLDFIPTDFDPDWAWNLTLPSLEDALKNIEAALNNQNLQFLVYKRLQQFVKLPKWGVDELHLSDLMDSVHKSILLQFKNLEIGMKHPKIGFCNKCKPPKFPKYDFNWETKIQTAKQQFEKKFAHMLSSLIANTGFASVWGYIRFFLEVDLLVILQLIVYFGLKNYTGNSNLLALFQTVGYSIAAALSRVTVAWTNRNNSNMQGIMDAISNSTSNSELVQKLKLAVDKLKSTVTAINENKGKVMPYLEMIGITVTHTDGSSAAPVGSPAAGSGNPASGSGNNGSASGSGSGDEKESDPNCSCGFFSFLCSCLKPKPNTTDIELRTSLVHNTTTVGVHDDSVDHHV